MKIKKYIHQIWIQGTAKVPKKYDAARSSWIEFHQDWYYKLWDINSLYPLLVENYPQYVYMYERFKHDIQRIHFFQYLLLYHYGGIVSQIDIVCLRNLEQLFEENELVFSEKIRKKNKKQKCLSLWSSGRLNDGPFLSLRFLASTEKNPFWLYVLREILIETTEKKINELLELLVSRSTGSTLLSRTFQTYSPKNFLILPRNICDPQSIICAIKMLTTLQIRKKRSNSKAYLLDQHDHTWSKNKRIYSILFFTIFLILAAVTIKCTIIKKEKRQSKKEKELSRMISILN